MKELCFRLNQQLYYFFKECFDLLRTEADLARRHTSKKELFTKIVGNYKLYTTTFESSILNI